MVVEEVEVVEDVPDFGGDVQSIVNFENTRSDIYENVRVRPLSLRALAEPVDVMGSRHGRVPRTVRETYLNSLPGFLYLDHLMKNSEIE